jgi:hypothetical protein
LYARALSPNSGRPSHAKKVGDGVSDAADGASYHCETVVEDDAEKEWG